MFILLTKYKVSEFPPNLCPSGFLIDLRKSNNAAPLSVYDLTKEWRDMCMCKFQSCTKLHTTEESVILH